MTSLPSWFNGIQPIWNIITPESDGFFKLDAQRVGCFPITVPVDGHLMFTVVQSWPQSQDWTLRCWVSLQPYDTSITFSNNYISSWQAPRAKLSVICLTSDGSVGTDPDGAVVYPLTVAAGEYYLNVQNLFNGWNGGYFVLTGADDSC
jgi:hypothetical protein